MTFSDLYGPQVLPGLILLIALIDDFRSRKIHNKLILFLLPLVLLAVALLKGVDGLMAGSLSALLAALVGLPLVLIKAIGGGDFKLLILFAFAVSWPELLKILIYSFPWALILGFFKIIFDKKLKDFFFNLFFLLRYRTAKGLEFHSIPFSLALFMAWLSFLTLRGLSAPSFLAW